MSNPDDSQKQLRKITMIAWVMLVFGPVLYLVLSTVLTIQGMSDSGTMDLIFYLLLVISLVQPAMYFLIERVQVSMFKENRLSVSTPLKFFFNLSIIKMAITEAVFIYGFIAFILSGDMTRMLWFYPIGIAWSVMYWPRRRKYDELIERLKMP